MPDGNNNLRGIVIISRAIWAEWRSIGVNSKACVNNNIKLVRIAKLPQKKLLKCYGNLLLRKRKEKNAVTMSIKNLYLSVIKLLLETSNLYYNAFFCIIIKRF